MQVSGSRLRYERIENKPRFEAVANPRECDATFNSHKIESFREGLDIAHFTLDPSLGQAVEYEVGEVATFEADTRRSDRAANERLESMSESTVRCVADVLVVL